MTTPDLPSKEKNINNLTQLIRHELESTGKLEQLRSELSDLAYQALGLKVKKEPDSFTLLSINETKKIDPTLLALIQEVLQWYGYVDSLKTISMESKTQLAHLPSRSELIETLGLNSNLDEPLLETLIHPVVTSKSKITSTLNLSPSTFVDPISSSSSANPCPSSHSPSSSPHRSDSTPISSNKFTVAVSPRLKIGFSPSLSYFPSPRPSPSFSSSSSTLHSSSAPFPSDIPLPNTASTSQKYRVFSSIHEPPSSPNSLLGKKGNLPTSNAMFATSCSESLHEHTVPQEIPEEIKPEPSLTKV